jgi:histidinol-phosphate aminotransferase
MTILKKSHFRTYVPARRSAIDLTLSENPLGPSPKVTEAIIKAAEKAYLYPDCEEALIALIAKHHHISENMILLGAGANELLEDFLKLFALGKNIVVPSATYPESVSCMATLQGTVESVSLHDDMSLNLEALLEAVKSDTALIHLCNPNNPTGIWTETSYLLKLANRSPVPLLISEAGADFVGKSILEHSLPPNVIVVRSFSKGYGLAGLRIGYSVASPEIIATIKHRLRSYRVSSVAIAAAIAALQDQEHLRQSVAYLLREKDWLMREMSALKFHVVPSDGQNFIARIPQKFMNADHFCTIIAQHGVAVVNCSIYPGLDQYIRISPRRHEINKEFILILKKIMETK